jgi:N-acetylglucosaminyldiphosphoundecaprenol N-acetyl-beta-D-mannosaminyltransferase
MKKSKIIYLFTLLPMLDLITSLFTRNGILVTPGTVIKGLLLLISTIYLIISKSKYKKICLIFTVFIFVYSILHFLFLNKINFYEISYFIKFIFFPIIYFALLCGINEFKIEEHDVKNVMVINILIYLSLLTIPYVFKGHIGYYFCDKELSNIMVLLFPMSYLMINDNRVSSLLIILISFITIKIGTVASVLGVVIVALLSFLNSIFRKKKIKYNLLILVCTCIFAYYSGVINVGLLNRYDGLVMPLLSMYGYGFQYASGIDFVDIYLSLGIVGLLIVSIPFIMTLYIVIINGIKIRRDLIYYTFLILLIIAVSNYSGHVFFSPSVTFFISIYLMLILYDQKILYKSRRLKSKVSILSLHMGYGGIEKTICDQANMICNYIDTEIICLYKLDNDLPYNLDSRVKIIYLSNLKPNRKEFMDELKDRNLIGILREGIKAVYILANKRILMLKYILTTDSKIIISTRLSFTKTLNSYHNHGSITIAEEHSYHKNNRWYIHRVKDHLSEIKYFMPSSLYLTNDYERYLRGLKVKVMYIPLTIDKMPKKLNKLDNYNIISVGRLSKEKGYDDLIKVMDLVVKKNKKIHLTLCGDGPAFDEIDSMIKEYGLEKNIKLTGFLNHEKILKEYEKASLYVMTSHEESFGLVLIEAMSYGIPCFAFDSALGACEIINNKKNGLLIRDRDIEKMANCIVDYFEKKTKYNTINTAKKYYVNNVEKEWGKFINSIK